MITIEDVKNMEEGIRDLEDTLEALPWFIWQCKMLLAMGMREAGLTEPVLQPADAPPVEAVAA